ncbi:BTB domain-containing protein [Caerostris extrusa]|uniref:BTB domain-containing protein n=1 Tax=Caerostris extrusa TaxID=172846 RepID=A0AAV4RV99_CAEEX|nr:BTB domain-containing protein [Caerostris extrusa]
MSTKTNQQNEKTKPKQQRWQNEIKSLKAGIAYIYQTKEFADIQLVVGARKFKAHRLILAARSPEFFKLLLEKQSNTSLTTIEIRDDIPEDGFEYLLRYIYTDELGNLSVDAVAEAYRAAAKFGQKGMMKLCEDRLAELEITCDNVCTFLDQFSDIESVKKKCLIFLKNNSLSVLTSENLKEASTNTLWIMFDGGYFKHAPPITRLRSAVRWASSQLATKGDYKLVRDLLLNPRPILGRCGINKLNIPELQKALAQYENLITAEEGFQFFMNANFSSGSKRLPAWCKIDD